MHRFKINQILVMHVQCLFLPGKIAQLPLSFVHQASYLNLHAVTAAASMQTSTRDWIQVTRHNSAGAAHVPVSLRNGGEST